MANEKRLVDLYVFLEECDRLLKNPPFVHPATPWDRGLMIAVETALSLPTVDAAPVVRCKDCQFSKYFEESGTRKCRTQGGLYRTVQDDDFCSYGEKKEE